MRILLISHEASRTGAPRVAILTARGLVARGHRVRVVSRFDGPLVAEFRSHAPTTVEFGTRVRRRIRGVPGLRRLAEFLDLTVAVTTIVRHRPDLVYVNSSAAAIYVRAAAVARRARLLHVHESGPVTATFLDTAGVDRALVGVTLLACSPSVRGDLQSLTGRGSADVLLLPSVPDDQDVVARALEPPDHRYSADELIVGCCGSVEHRKGADLWVDIARRVAADRPDLPVRFVWVGDISDPVALAPTDQNIDFIGVSQNPYPHLQRFDIATLPSRDDPFPLVVLEAMMLGTPVVAFGVGGVATQVGDSGLLIEPNDVEAFAAGIVQLLVDEEERHRLGTMASDRVHELFSTRAFEERLGRHHRRDTDALIGRGSPATGIRRHPYRHCQRRFDRDQERRRAWHVVPTTL